MSVYSFYSRCVKQATPIFAATSDQSLSQRLLLYSGFISPSSSGIFALCPNFVRTFDKLSVLVNRKMTSVGAERLILPTLGSRSIWEASGRWKTKDSQFFVLEDRCGKQFCLQPTHEEEITTFVRKLGLSYKQLPLLFYQIGYKFRDEMRPRYGLLRCREFIMKDMYSFDATYEDAIVTYNNISRVYSELFDELGLPYYRVLADSGDIGGNLSHEFHLPISLGEDRLCVCSKCGVGFNAEVKDGLKQLNCQASVPEQCPHSFQEIRGLEVAHCFLLGQRYSKCFDATYSHSKGKDFLEMGCYGIGMTRLLAGAVEYLTAAAFPNRPMEQITDLRWPPGLAPFSVALALQKENAPDALGSDLLKSILDSLSHESDGSVIRQSVDGDFLVDDRRGLTLGRKLVDLKRLGIPWVVALKAHHDSRSTYELIDVYGDVSYEATLDQLRELLRNPQTFDSSILLPWRRRQPVTTSGE
ncbi:Prolyl tRNA synthetase mitochondrial [Fasciolopsis buskii]|uniref:proline--tRNA ligase n=1 Tax=Fasciolopsis buskii TaxID=27845 RepID=A0A8E0RUE7_9TREM|nr:Prolyl tRNA synthetase mitochondrial [Fasciolopsis buski]